MKHSLEISRGRQQAIQLESPRTTGETHGLHEQVRERQAYLCSSKY
jgi:hypothetical protein